MLEGLLVAVIIGVIIQFVGTGVIDWFDERAFAKWRKRRRSQQPKPLSKEISRPNRIMTSLIVSIAVFFIVIFIRVFSGAH